MNMKKILALTILVIAVFSCMNVASAGLFDFLGGGGVANATYTFDGFTLDLPETAVITNNTTTEEGYQRIDYEIEWNDTENEDTLHYIDIYVSSGEQVVSSIDEYIDNWAAEGAKTDGTYNNWTIINIDGVPISAFAEYEINITYSGYVFAKHTGSKLIVISGDDLAELKSIVDTYKEV
ncbi:hypothetical protein [Methanobrevibacter sp.]|uniref:hypothetical protein n=1 Tax=Methanobrevibacter sp. TaxID=66852 RepID=UPI0025CCA681|nr:hypothetical protein [Methanobrevibacter sp.]MBQ6512953.1 hypothetical protein [Methanobrevibacter sp.]